jgi:bacteriocin-like protein
VRFNLIFVKNKIRDFYKPKKNKIMKTNLFKKSSKGSEIVEMSKEELQTIQGGATWYYYIDKNGKKHFQIVLQN